MIKLVKVKKIIFLGLVVILGVLGWQYFEKNFNNKIVDSYIKNMESTVGEELIPTPTEVAKKITRVVLPIKPIVKSKPTPTDDGVPWGVSQQIDPHTWTLKIGMDAKMATPSEILTALNNYRQRKGSQPLIWDDNLGNFAQSRAGYLALIKNTDSHKGFEDYLNNQDGFAKLGFNWLGENISYGYKLEAVHIIEWMYAGDKPHDNNQLDPKWDHVGIGVKDTATCLIFATAKR